MTPRMNAILVTVRSFQYIKIICFNKHSSPTEQQMAFVTTIMESLTVTYPHSNQQLADLQQTVKTTSLKLAFTIQAFS